MTSEQAALTSGADFWHTASTPPITLTDGPHGVRLAGTPGDPLTGRPATCFPPAVTTGSTWDPDLLRRLGEALGDEARSMGVAVLLGPGVNLKRSPLCGRNFEYFSEDPLLTGVLATAWVRGLQSRGVGASVKHFAVNSQETDRMTVSADVDERTLRELYLTAFQRVVREARPWTVMCSYNQVNGVYASQNHFLLTDVLRGEWGFDGVVVSDWGAVVDRVAAVAAGLDLAMPGPDDTGDRALVEAVAGGRLAPEALATAADRVLTLVRRAAARQAGEYDRDAHHALAREIAARGTVLLKNERAVLPLPADTSVAVLGEYARTPRYQGGGSSAITPTRLDVPLTRIATATSAPVRFAPGYGPPGPDGTPAEPDPALIVEAVAAARESDVALVFVGTPEETEGRDRTCLDLPAAHVDLIRQVAAANPRTVVVMCNGGVVRTTPWDAEPAAVLECWLPGQAAGSALADVLFGQVDPSGRLAETIPLRLADHPSYLDLPGTDGHLRYGEGIHVGYRGFDAREQEVAYPFGFGLSYTTFEYGTATATADDTGIRVRVEVTNTGDRDGREVVQAYVSRPGSRVRRAPRELKAFANVPIAAGATAEVVLDVARDDLGHWDVALGRWLVEGGPWHVSIGASSRDLRTTVVVDVPGDEVHVPLTAGSSLADWFADPRGARLLGAALAGPPGSPAVDPALLAIAAAMPLDRLARLLPGGPLDPAAVAALVAAANS
ncbi:glycoside hydrolase family 3 C-terminal domain-containing protein [Actinosynnema sp. NPDC047251]|uniref:Exo-alpha-(1->6)-L-arabinopyranosidase n=1 Tax=Saccharothrix espanaensis (strain ATCC 51144 / DSM 44229 / JCM 9112 / NBRC 15066 / NRRL 15764) TaxID=1179773 RepID=K0K125_SACES|nr:glycoside hydrolase family 3 C-terminal domain-containing protein [Saccharothrix espanaensis]CCH31252.1 Thermostable beta-glucosidase B [Saccharothrix espanaensis DSM 44229]